MSTEDAVVALAGSRVRLDNIDALRAVAVIAVMLFHYTARFPQDYVQFSHPTWQFSYGFMGVDLFFIISGYCIAMTARHCRDAGAFWAKRFSRLQPAYVTAILITFAVVSCFGLPGREVLALEAFGNMAWLNGLGVMPHVDGVYWALIAEAKLYLLFGLLFFTLRLRGDVLLWWAALCFAGVLVALLDHRYFGGAVQTRSLDLASFVCPASAFFLAGMLIYHWDATAPWKRFLIIAVFVVVCVLSTQTWIHAVLLMALFPLAKLALDWRSARIPAPIVFVGFVSYPLYLIHQHVGIVVLRQTAGIVPSEYGRIALAAASVLLLAAAVSVMVEHRFRSPLERLCEAAFSALSRLPALARITFYPGRS